MKTVLEKANSPGGFGEKTMKNIKIKLKGKLKEALGDRDDLFIIGDMNCGAIATEQQYLNFLEGTAFLNRNGDVKRRGRTIGNVSDIEEVKGGDL